MLTFRKDAIQTLDYTPGTAKAAGDVVVLPDGRAGVVKTDLAANEAGSVYVAGLFTADADTVTVAVGDPILYDTDTELAVTTSTATTIHIGTITVAGTSATEVTFLLNEGGLMDRQNNVITYDTAAPAIAGSGVIFLSGADNACAATLAAGTKPGQEVMVTATSVANAVTLTVASHYTSNPEVFTFGSALMTVILRWNGAKWITVSTVGTPTV